MRSTKFELENGKKKKKKTMQHSTQKGKKVVKSFELLSDYRSSAYDLTMMIQLPVHKQLLFFSNKFLVKKSSTAKKITIETVGGIVCLEMKR
jgi:hypothetical protein